MAVTALKTRIWDKVGIPITLDRISISDGGNYFKIVLKEDNNLTVTCNGVHKTVSFQELLNILYEGIKR